MFHDTFQRLDGEVQAAPPRIALFEQGDDTKALDVVIEAAVIFHQAVERIFSRMAERRMTEIMSETDDLDQIFVRHRARGPQ